VPALVFAAVAFLAGCVRQQRHQHGASPADWQFTYLLYTLGGMVNGLKNYRFLSPFYHYMEPDTAQIRTFPGACSRAFGLAVIFFAFSIPAFIRRDIAR